jgi:malonyl CoA-acyl carrier protein transacylase
VRGLAAHVAIAIAADDAFVVGGTSDALAAVEQRANARNARVTCLRVGVASHTPLLAAAVRAVSRSAGGVPIGALRTSGDRRHRPAASSPHRRGRSRRWRRNSRRLDRMGQCLDTLYELAAA